MSTFKQIRHRWETISDVPKLTLLATLVGALAGLVIVGFRLVVEHGHGLVSFGTPTLSGHSEPFHLLPDWLRFCLPFGGAVLLGLFFHFLDDDRRSIGVTHVIERVVYFKSILPIKNAIVQFVGASVALITGHSVGREGPNIHLGATSGSVFADFFKLPSEHARVLVAAGSAAGIAASFNTPLAGVIFAMEVIMMEYSVTGFMPIIIASVVGTVITRTIFGNETAFEVPLFEFSSLLELPFLLFLGIIIGLMAATFISLHRFTASHTRAWPIFIRMSLAGLIMGGIALWMPSAMGISYETVNRALGGQLGLTFLVAFLTAKFIATNVCFSLKIPGGIIGPTIVIGAAIGGVMGIIGGTMSDNASHTGFYVLLGMVAMMGATLQAPLAALTAIMELTANPNMILPGMMVVVTACLISGYLFRQDSIFLSALKDQGFIIENTYLRDKYTDKEDGPK